MNMAVLWVVAPCSLVIRAIALMMEAASTSETSVISYQTTRRNNPEDSHLVQYCSKVHDICEQLQPANLTILTLINDTLKNARNSLTPNHCTLLPQSVKC
jgi:hypothetical protein